MKPILYTLCGISIFLILTSSTSYKAKTPLKFEKIAWVELNFQNDSMLFIPHSMAWNESWQNIDCEMYIFGSSVMNYTRYKSAFQNRKDNLYTLLHPQIINGSLAIYSPYDPNSFFVSDHGEMRYPLKAKNSTETFLSSDNVRAIYAYHLGMFGPQSDYPMVDEYGDPLILTDSISGIQMFKYPPRDYLWYSDKDITKYRIRIKILYNKNGIEKKRSIESIAPIVSTSDGDQIIGEKELFWLDFNKDLVTMLKTTYYFDTAGKPRTYLEHIKQKVMYASL